MKLLETELSFNSNPQKIKFSINCLKISILFPLTIISFNISAFKNEFHSYPAPSLRIFDKSIFKETIFAERLNYYANTRATKSILQPTTICLQILPQHEGLVSFSAEVERISRAEKNKITSEYCFPEGHSKFFRHTSQ